MSYRSAEREFYLRHYAGGVAPGRDFHAEEVRARLFDPGRRYHLLYRKLKERRPSGTLIEVGCGNGDSLIFLNREFAFARAVGIDLAVPAGASSVESVEFLPANFNDRLPLEAGSVDVFVAMMVIEHLFDPFHAFREIRRTLAPDGFAAINLPLVTSVKNRLRLAAGLLPVTSVDFPRWLIDEEWDGNHLHYFSLDSIRRLVEKCGLRLASISAVGRFHRVKECLPSLLANEITFLVERRA